VYIQEEATDKERGAPPDYSGHTYAPPPSAVPEESAVRAVSTSEETTESAKAEKTAPAGAFSGKESGHFSQNSGKRGGFFENLGLGGLFSRVPFLSSLAPPPRHCTEGARKHGELWDLVLLAVIALALLGERDDDVLPILLLLLLWD